MKGLPPLYCKSLYREAKAPWRFSLLMPVEVVLSNGDKITIPARYVTDFASVPRLLRGLVATCGNHNLATLIHDWLYDTQYKFTGSKNWQEDRKLADKEMLHWLKASGVSWFKRNCMYLAVRLRGRKGWLEKPPNLTQ